MPKWKDPEDIKRIRRVRKRLDAERAAERGEVVEPPKKPVLTKVPRPLQEREGFKHDALDSEVQPEVKPKRKRKSSKKKKKDKKKD